MGQPLSVRRGVRQPLGPEDGVPASIRGPIAELLSIVWRIGYADYKQNRIQAVAAHAGIPLPMRLTGQTMLSAITDWAVESDDNFLDLIDAAIVYGSFESGQLGYLESLLETARVNWTATPHGLENRVDPTAIGAANAATSPADRASDELREAWHNVYGRSNDPSDAWDHAIKAVEEVLIPIVVPNKAKATLGDVLGQMKAASNKISLTLQTSGPVASGETLEAMLRLMWPNPDRHGGAGGRVPSLEEARAVVHMAVTVVQWARDGVVA